MKRFLLLFFIISTTSALIAQPMGCVTEALVDVDTIDCGDTATITVNSFAESLLTEVFDPTGPTDPGWSQTAGAIYTNPYIPSPTNDTYFWMGATSVLPAALESNAFNVQFGGQICFDFVYAVQGGSAPTEGPDLSEEGITLQYSTDGGVTWNDIVYMMPNGEFLPSNPGPGAPMTNPPFSSTGTPFTVWNSVCFTLPAGALTTSTSFQWIQEFNSGACCDHWGLDNIQILAADPAYGLFDDQGSFLPTNVFPVSPTSDTTYSYLYTNGIDDSCTTSISVYLNPTDAGPDIMVSCDGIGTQLQSDGVAPWSTVSWTPATGLSDATDPNPFANPLVDTDYILTSDCGTDTVTVFVEDSFDITIAVPDTMCVNGSTFLNLATSPPSVTIASVEWEDAGSLNSPTGYQVVASPSVTTQYIATVTSDSGCVIQDSVLVYVQGVAAQIEINPSNPDVCLGSTVDLTADVIVPNVPYTSIVGTYSLQDTSIGTPITGLTDDNFLGPFPIGFNFPYFGNNQNIFYVSSNGFITFGNPGGSFLGNLAIPNTANPNNMIAWCWDDLDFSVGGTASYYVGGTAPNQYLVLNFLDVPHAFSTTTVSVQLVLYQNGTIVINNIDVQPDNAFATMTQGFENNFGTIGVAETPFNNTSWTSIQETYVYAPFTPPTNPTYTWTPATYLNTTSGPNVTSTPSGDIEYFVTMEDGFCTSIASTFVNVDSIIVDSISDDILLECPEANIDLYSAASTTIFNDLVCNGPVGICNAPQQVGQVGTGTGTTGTSTTASTGNTPFGYWFANGKRHMLYTAAELNAMGFTGGNIYSFALNITQKNTSNPFPNFAVGMKCVSSTDISDISESGFTEVYSNTSYSTVNGWNTFNFTTPYVWDGVSNLLVQVCFGTGSTPWHVNDHVQVSNVGVSHFAWGYEDNTGGPTGCNNTQYTSTGTSTSKPNAQFGYCNVTPGFADLTYTWSTSPSWTIDNPSDSSTFITSTIDQSTEAYITITDGICTTVDTVIIDFGAGYTISNDTAICEGQSVQLNVNGGTNHVWTPDNGTLSATNIPNPVATPQTSTDYIVNLDLTNCSVEDTITVIVNPSPDVEINGGVTEEVVCDGADVDLISDADAAWNNNWTGPITGSGTSLTVDEAGLYTLTSVDGNGCINIENITVSFNDNPILDPNVIQNILCCEGDEVSVNFQDMVTNGIILAEAYWDNGATNEMPSYLVSSNEDGTYDVLVVSQEGCEATTQLTFETNCINPDIVDIDSLVFGEVHDYQVNADYTLSEEVWSPSFNGNSFTANTVSNDFETVNLAASAEFMLNDGTTYTCTEFDSSTVFIALLSDPVLPDAFTPNGDNVNNKFFPVNLDPNTTIEAFTVYNRWGDVVYEYNGDDGWDGTWQGEGQPEDVYTYYLVVDKTTSKFITSGSVTLIR